MILGGTSVFFVVFCSKTPKLRLFIVFNSNQEIQFFDTYLGPFDGPLIGLLNFIMTVCTTYFTIIMNKPFVIKTG